MAATSKRRLWPRLLLGVVGAVALLAVGLVGFAQVRKDRTFEVPEPDLKASTDPAVIARGKELVYGSAYCSNCHTPKDRIAELEKGAELPLSGGGHWNIPPGELYAPNLTPDPETGIGKMTDGQIARMLRHGVRRDGKVAFPFMAYHKLSDQDVVAVISFLRTQAPVQQAWPERKLSLLGSMVMAYAIQPYPGTEAPKTTPTPGPTADYGRYLADAVANCKDCHTQRDLKDGSFIGPEFAGGFEMPLENKPGFVLVTPNLTADPKTGFVGQNSEDAFIARFRKGRTLPESPMPWGSFNRMSDDDLRAIYRFLATVPAVEANRTPYLREG